MEYKYHQDDCPQKKIDYSYSQYSGVPFLNGFLAYRRKYLEKQSLNRKVQFDTVSGSATELLFMDWLARMTKKESFALEKLDTLLKRFEVTKRIYSQYDAKFRPIGDKNYSELRLYCLFSHVLIYTFETYGYLQYLNSLIKVNDIVSSFFPYLSEQDRQLAMIGFEDEIRLIEELKNSLGIK